MKKRVIIPVRQIHVTMYIQKQDVVIYTTSPKSPNVRLKSTLFVRPIIWLRMPLIRLEQSKRESLADLINTVSIEDLCLWYTLRYRYARIAKPDLM